MRCSCFCFHDRTAVRSGAEISLLSLWLSSSQGMSLLADFLLASKCSIKKLPLEEGPLHLTLWSETSKGVVDNKVLPELGGIPRSSLLSTKLLLPFYCVTRWWWWLPAALHLHSGCCFRLYSTLLFPVPGCGVYTPHYYSQHRVASSLPG